VYEDRIEMVEHELAVNTARGDQAQACDVLGNWDIYGPDYLDLREITLRKSWEEEKCFDFRHYKRGILNIVQLSDDALVQAHSCLMASRMIGTYLPTSINLHRQKCGRTRLTREGSMERGMKAQRFG
jgi:hypothetical protein